MYTYSRSSNIITIGNKKDFTDKHFYYHCTVNKHYKVEV